MDMLQFHHSEDNIELSQTPDNSSTPDAHLKKSEPAGKLPATKKWGRPTMSPVLNPWWQDKKWWSTVLVISRVIGVSFDPLFLYIPYINNDQKCMERNETVQAAALVFRSLTDFIVLLDIMYQIGQAIAFADSNIPRSTKPDPKDAEWNWGSSMTRVEMREFAVAFSRSLSWRSFLTDIFSILPIPQVLILGLFFKMGDNINGDFLIRRKILSTCLLVQYLPRIYRIYLSSTMVSDTTTLVKAASYFFLYIIASHVLGAFWYFFSLQRLASCWYRNCREVGITHRTCTFNCPKNLNNTIRDSLDAKCYVKKPWNDTDPPFDFGMFFDALGNDITGQIDFPKKLGYCVWWGLRNLSNFGTSLETSTHLLENCFAILISIIGLLLFLYLIGNVQSYMQMATIRAAEIQKKLESTKKDIEKWMETNKLGEDMKEEIRNNVKLKLEEDINADLKRIFCILPWKTRKALARMLCSSTIHRVPKLRQMDEQVLDSIYTYMKPVHYAADTYIFHQGDPLDRTVFITDGTVHTYMKAAESSNTNNKAGKEEASSLVSVSSVDTNTLKSGDCYGIELLEVATSSCCTKLPPSLENVRCHTDVEAFVLKKSDLESIISSNYNSWTSGVNASASQV